MNSNLTTEELDRLESLAAAATQGEWAVRKFHDLHFDEDYWSVVLPDEPNDRPIGTIFGHNAVWLEQGQMEGENAEHIAAMHNDFPALVAGYRRMLTLEQEANEALDALELLCSEPHPRCASGYRCGGCDWCVAEDVLLKCGRAPIAEEDR